MVKCSECGYSNNPMSSKACIKCDSKLDVIVPAVSIKPKPTVSNLKKTQVGKGSLKSTVDDQQISATPITCSKCSYNIRVGQSICPNCGYDNFSNIQSSSDSTKGSGPNTIRLNDFVTEDEPETIEEKRAIAPSFSLSPINGDKKESIVKEGDIVGLSRSDFDTKDMTISSKEHLKLEFEDGEWHLSNTSTNGALFIQVKDKIKITGGQVLLIGQKKYYRFDPTGIPGKNIEEE